MKTNILLIFLFVVQAAMSQNDKNFPSIEQLTEHKWQEISEKAKLTDAEKKAVYPLFVEYEQSLFSLNKTLWAAFRNVRKNTGHSEKIDFAQVNDLYVNTEIKQAELLKNYHEKLQKLLSPESLFNFYLAERNFKKNLMQNISNKNKK
ncbi:MAG: hypothetical protein FWD66_04910 [Paludibacter sp.]|nr:hypothetical protein [Paludibacter sp.]